MKPSKKYYFNCRWYISWSFHVGVRVDVAPCRNELALRR